MFAITKGKVFAFVKFSNVLAHLAVSVEEVAPALHLVAAAGYPLDGAAHPKLEAVRAPPSAHSGVRRAKA